MKNQHATLLYALLLVLGSVSCRTCGNRGSSLSAETSACEKNGGTVHAYLVGNGEEPWCLFGKAMIAARTLQETGRASQPLAVKAFFRSGPQPTASSANSAIQLANPASTLCANLAGTSQSMSDGSGQWGACHFHDQSAIDEWTLFRGPDDAGNVGLVKALRAQME